MGTSNIIVREYLESLGEDQELDKIFPLLLNLMGFKLVSTPRDSKGQSQYGKDIVAVKEDTDGIKKRFYFELKGFADKDIDDNTFSKKDGIRDSLIAAKYADFRESAIQGFAEMPKKFVLVHNGIVKANTRPTLEGFITQEFDPGQFERWDIHTLTDLFSKYLFGEYLLTDDHSINLFKKTLVLLDVPDYDLKDFKELVNKLLGNDANVQTRRFLKMFTTLNLLSYILFHYSKQADNLEPAKNGLTYLILQTWAWILKNKLENRKPVISKFQKLLKVHHNVLDEYFKKTLKAALFQDGLCSERGGPFEAVGYPLRAMEYLNYLVYFCMQRMYWPSYDKTININKKSKLETLQKDLIFSVIESNDGCTRPVLDKHSLPLLLVFIYCQQCEILSKNDQIRLNNYFVTVFDNIALIYGQRRRLPEFTDNVDALIEFTATGLRPPDYSDKSSHLLLILFELSAILGLSDVYSEARLNFMDLVNLQTANSILTADVDFEQMMFEGNTHEYMTVETSIKLPENIQVFKDEIKAKTTPLHPFRTDKAGFKYLRFLAAIYYSNDIFPEDWRHFLTVPN